MPPAACPQLRSDPGLKPGQPRWVLRSNVRPPSHASPRRTSVIDCARSARWRKVGQEVIGMIKVAVYTFQGGDADKRLRAAGLRMATLDAIRRVRGEPDFNSGQLVDESEIDDSGFYSGSPN
jgi:hypothetical protein